jgi:hypothetical protein
MGLIGLTTTSLPKSCVDGRHRSPKYHYQTESQTTSRKAPEVSYSSPLSCPNNEFPKVPEIAADDALVDKEPMDFVGRDLLLYPRRKVGDPWYCS